MMAASSVLSLISLIVITLASSAASSSSVTNLTQAGYYSNTAGKTVFLKMFAPWCGHCKAMAEDWEKLAADYEGNDHILIAQVDCTDEAGGAELCQELEVESFPTLLYGDPLELNTYDDDRDYQALSEFAMKNLRPRCSAVKLDFCNDQQKALIKELSTLSWEELEERMQSVNELFEIEEKRFQEEVAGIEKLITDVEERENDVLALMKQVQIFLQNQKKGDDEL